MTCKKCQTITAGVVHGSVLACDDMQKVLETCSRFPSDGHLIYIVLDDVNDRALFTLSVFLCGC